MTTDDDRINHLAGVPGAAVPDDERAALDAVRELLADPDLWSEPPGGLGDDVVAAISAASQTAPLPDGLSDDPPSAVQPPAPVTDLTEARRRRSWAALAAAAALVAVVAVGAFVVGRSDPVETFAFTVETSELAPEASGDVEASKSESGWRIELDIDGLPRRDGGEFYEAWLRNDDGTLVSVGTFNEGTDVVLWAGVPISEFSTLTVTAESADGDPSSSGERVLIATLTG